MVVLLTQVVINSLMSWEMENTLNSALGKAIRMLECCVGIGNTFLHFFHDERCRNPELRKIINCINARWQKTKKHSRRRFGVLKWITKTVIMLYKKDKFLRRYIDVCVIWKKPGYVFYFTVHMSYMDAF